MKVITLLLLLVSAAMWSVATWIVYNGRTESAPGNAVLMLIVGSVVALVAAAIALDEINR